LSAQAGAYRHYEEAKAKFAEIRRQGDYALTALPTHRDLVDQISARALP
jgi:tryptophan halogenase